MYNVHAVKAIASIPVNVPKPPLQPAPEGPRVESPEVRDTTGEYGSPNIVDTVFAKIDRSRFF